MKRILILSTTMVLGWLSEVSLPLEKITINHFSNDIRTSMNVADIVLVFDKENFRELKQRFSLETNRVFPLHTLKAYLEYWS